MQTAARYAALFVLFTASAVLCQACALVGVLTLALQLSPNCTAGTRFDYGLVAFFQAFGIVCMGVVAFVGHRLLDDLAVAQPPQDEE